MRSPRLFACAVVAMACIGTFITPMSSRVMAHESSAKENIGDEFAEEIVVDWEEAEEISAAENSEDADVVVVNEGIAEADDLDESEEATLQSVRVNLFKIKGWPEFKVESKKVCKRVLGRKVCIKVPQAFQRSCELVAYAEIKHPKARTIETKIVKCARQAVGAGVLAGIYTGDLNSAAAALKVYLKSCLAVAGVDQLNSVSVTVRTETKCGGWKPR